jgi:uncharacterized membrane protein
MNISLITLEIFYLTEKTKSAMVLSIALFALYIELPVWIVMVVLFVRSMGTAFHSPALSAVTPLLVPEDQLTRCAGYSQSIQSISYIVSPGLLINGISIICLLIPEVKNLDA